MKPRPQLFSASQVSTFELCERKWGWTYLENIRPPPHPRAALGSQIHEFLQVSLETCFWDLSFEHWSIVEPARKFLEAIPVDADIEHYFEHQLNDHKFRGYKDARWLGPGGVPVVLDHKTTGNFDWIKKPEDLLKDVQATLYAHHEMSDRYVGDPGPVDLLWQYYRTRDAPLTKQVHLRVLPRDVQPRIDKTIASADRMRAAIDAGMRGWDMPPDWDACGAFGGCYFREHCEQEEKAKGTGIHVDEKRKALMNVLNGMANSPTPASAPPVDDPPGSLDAVPPAFNAPVDGEFVMPAPKDAPVSYELTSLAIEATETKPAPPKGQVKRKKTTLYVNCMPLTGKLPASASVLFAKATAKLEHAHYKLAPFGTGPALFAAALREVIDGEGGLPPEVYLWTGTSEGRDAYEVLVGYADNVIMGVPG